MKALLIWAWLVSGSCTHTRVKRGKGCVAKELGTSQLGGQRCALDVHLKIPLDEFYDAQPPQRVRILGVRAHCRVAVRECALPDIATRQ